MGAYWHYGWWLWKWVPLWCVNTEWSFAVLRLRLELPSWHSFRHVEHLCGARGLCYPACGPWAVVNDRSHHMPIANDDMKLIKTSVFKGSYLKFTFP